MAKRKGNSLKKLLNNQIVFLVVLTVCILNLIGYISHRMWNSVFFFLLIATITYYFSRNPTIILIISLLATNFYRTSNRMQPRVEAMGGKREGLTEEDDEDEVGDGSALTANALTATAKAGGTLEGLDEKLVEAKTQQAGMVELLKKMEPLVNESMKMLETLPVGTIEKLSDRLNQTKALSSATE
jgi:hypothetical protein